MKNFLLLFSSVVIFSSCYYDNEELIYGKASCDTINVKYSVHIVNTLAANCLSCHGGNAASGAGIQLGNYNAVKTQALNGRLLSALEQAPSFSPMPKGAGKLNDCRIAEIRTWIRNGTPEN